MTLRKLEPEFHSRVWGAQSLGPWFPQTPPSIKQIGEVWFQTKEIPLLVKFLFTTQNLSVQVHPDDAYAQKHHQSPGKTEMWHVLAADPGAKIASGFRTTVTREQAREAALTGEIEGLLEWHSAAKEDTFFIPAGTVHAIGAGLTICEIQQVSDVVYRLYDYRRPGLDGKPRELHLDHGLAVSELGPSAGRAALPVECKYFLTAASNQFESEHDQLAIAIEGEGQIGETPVRQGEVVFVPKGTKANVSGDLQWLRTWVP